MGVSFPIEGNCAYRNGHIPPISFLPFPITSSVSAKGTCMFLRGGAKGTQERQVGGKEGEEAPQPHLRGQSKARAQSEVLDPTLGRLWSRFQLFLGLEGLGTSRSLCAPVGRV